MILDRPPKDWKRPTMPKGVVARVFTAQGGRCKVSGDKLMPGCTQYDHRPPLSERKFDTEAWDTIPRANDPAFIEALTTKAHDKRTNGPGGEKRITTYGSDAHARAKIRKLTGANKPKVKAKIPSRPFPKGRGFPKRKDRTWPSPKA